MSSNLLLNNRIAEKIINKKTCKKKEQQKKMGLKSYRKKNQTKIKFEKKSKLSQENWKND